MGLQLSDGNKTAEASSFSEKIKMEMKNVIDEEEYD
jgi:hypothetical protein